MAAGTLLLDDPPLLAVLCCEGQQNPAAFQLGQSYGVTSVCVAKQRYVVLAAELSTCQADVFFESLQ